MSGRQTQAEINHQLRRDGSKPEAYVAQGLEGLGNAIASIFPNTAIDPYLIALKPEHPETLWWDWRSIILLLVV